MRMRRRSLAQAALLLSLLLGATACVPDADVPTADAGQDAGLDGGVPADGGLPDAGAPDAGALSCAPAELPPLESGAWDRRFTIAGVAGHDGLVPSVYDFATDSDGSLLVTGRFEYLGQERVVPLLRLQEGVWRQAREEWPAQRPVHGFSALAVGSQGELALSTGDAFGERVGQIWLDRGEGLRAIGHFSGLVRRLLWVDGALWVAGNFTLEEAPGAPGLAVWNGTSWSSPPGGSADAPVFELWQEGESLWVGGGFDSIGGISARRIAEWNGTTWQAHDMNLAIASVYALSRGADGAMYAGGVLVEDPETMLGGIARLEGTTWALLGKGVSNGFFPGVVSDLLLDEGKLYVAGCFKTVSGTDTDVDAVRARSFARWTGSAWESLSDPMLGVGTPWFSTNSCGDDGPESAWDMEYQRLYKSGSTVYLAGSFPGVNGTSSQGLIGFDVERETFLPQGAPEQGVAGVFEDLAVGGPDCAVYGLGKVTHVGTEKVPGRVARYHEGWSIPAGALPEGAECTEIEVDGDGEVYVGCTHFDVFAGRVYRLESNSWQAVGAPLEGRLIMDLARDPQGGLWAAGGAEKGFVARLEGEAFTVVEEGFDAPITHLAFRPTTDAAAPLEYVVAGYFTHRGEDAFNHIARWDGEAWNAMGEGLSATPSALEFGANAIYASSVFEGSNDRFILGRWDGGAWEELATPERGLPVPIGDAVHTFMKLREVGSSLVATGGVWPKTGGRNAFVFDGEAFSAIGGGVNAIGVGAVEVTREGLWFGGSIADTGMGPQRLPSVGMAHFRWSAAP